MGDRAMLSKFMFHWELRNTQEFGACYKVRVPACYEVIRVIGGKALFLDEHYARLEGSAASIGKSLPFTIEELDRHISELMQANGVQNYNVKFIMNGFEEEEGPYLYLFMNPTSYPTEEMYRDGVATDLLRIVRKNPHAKIINQSLRDQADALMAEKELFEALLVNDKEEITEGSKSNVFFIRGDVCYTCPSEGVLLGVTRQRILRIAKEGGIEIREESIPAGSLSSFDAAFISGTSPKILPIARIGEIPMNPDNPVLRRLMALYDEEIRKYLAR